MDEAKWFPIRNFFNSKKNSSNKLVVKDIYGNDNEVSIYSHGVIIAANRNGHFKF